MDNEPSRGGDPGGKERILRVAMNFSLFADVLTQERKYRDYQEMWMHKIYGGLLYRILQNPSPIVITKLSANAAGVVSLETLVEAAGFLDGLII